MNKTILPINARIKKEYELVTLSVKKIGDLNRRTGEFTFCQRSRESTHPDALGSGFDSGDDGRHEIKNSLSDSIIEIGGSTQTFTVKSKTKFVPSIQQQQVCQKNYSELCKQQGVTLYTPPFTSLNKEISGAEKDENTTVDAIRRTTEDEAKAARIKQIKDFFTDPVDREIFPLHETKKSLSRPIIPREIPSIEESVTKMLEQFRTALRNEENALEAHRHSCGVFSPPLGQVNTHDQRKLVSRVQHRSPWYFKLCCCGGITNPKKIKLENR